MPRVHMDRDYSFIDADQNRRTLPRGWTGEVTTKVAKDIEKSSAGRIVKPTGPKKDSDAADLKAELARIQKVNAELEDRLKRLESDLKAANDRAGKLEEAGRGLAEDLAKVQKQRDEALIEMDRLGGLLAVSADAAGDDDGADPGDPQA
ncbi:MAG: hypothetical protein AAF334_00105 [Pseudomonadota bacterium]